MVDEVVALELEDDTLDDDEMLVEVEDEDETLIDDEDTLVEDETLVDDDALVDVTGVALFGLLQAVSRNNAPVIKIKLNNAGTISFFIFLLLNNKHSKY